jgi:spore germination protein PC
MYPGLDIYRFLQTLYETMQQQQARLAGLEQQIKRMNDHIQELSEKPNTHIDKIEYHFDQLKVETLEGTLNIGITPQAEATIEDYQAGPHAAQDLKSAPQPTGPFPGIQREMYRYLDQEAKAEIAQLEQVYGVTLDDEYRGLMVDDVRRQIDGRIREYLRRHPEAREAQPAAARALEEEITYKVKNDVKTALRNYFNNLPRGGGTNGEDESRQ